MGTTHSIILLWISITTIIINVAVVISTLSSSDESSKSSSAQLEISNSSSEESCPSYHWRDPLSNTPRCQPCECNGHATSECHPESGKCYCITKGVWGDHCDKCDTRNNYTSDDYHTASCYYKLESGNLYTFNISKPHEINFTEINLKIVPPAKDDREARFTLVCIDSAKFNLSVLTSSSEEEKFLYVNEECSATSRNITFPNDYQFGPKAGDIETRFYVKVFDFKSPFVMQISFAQYSKLNIENLKKFVSTVSGIILNLNSNSQQTLAH